MQFVPVAQVEREGQEVNFVEFSIPQVPRTINWFMTHHWTKKHENKRVWMQEFSAMGTTNKRFLKTWAECGNKVRVEITVLHVRAFDPDNLVSAAKIPLDAMVTMKMLPGDKHSDIELFVTQEISKEKLTKFKITRLA